MKRNILILSILILSILVLLIMSCSKKLTESDNSNLINLKGTIVKVVSNENSFYTVTGLETATITLEPGHKVVMTDNNGNYSFPGLEAGFYSLTVSKDGYYNTSDQFDLTNISNKIKNYYLERMNYSIPIWQHHPFGVNGGVISVGAEGLYVFSHGSKEVFGFIDKKYKNQTQYEFQCDMLKDPSTTRVGFFTTITYPYGIDEMGEYFNLDQWKHSIQTIDIFDKTIIDSQLVYDDNDEVIDTLYTYPDSVIVSIRLKAEGGLTQGVFNNIKINFKGNLKKK